MRAHHLEESLRQLKLFGMLDTLEARLAQAGAGELGHVELLQSLCEDESTRRDAVGLERRLKAARFEQSCAIEDFDFAFNPKIPATQIRDLATLRFIEENRPNWKQVRVFDSTLRWRVEQKRHRRRARAPSSARRRRR